MVKSEIEKRCPTGIPGFDDLCEGGLYRNSVNALLGGPGSGKTTFLLHYLYNGAKKFNENGLYVSFESHDEDVYEDAMNYKMDMAALAAEGKFQFLRFSPKTSVDRLKIELDRYILKNDIKRVCIDPISILSINLRNESSIREVIYDLTTMLKRLRITTLMADETVEGRIENFSLGSEEIRTQSIKFLCDGLVNLYSAGLGGDSDRAIRITKMRRTDHVRGPIPFKITKNGILVDSKKRL